MSIDTDTIVDSDETNDKKNTDKYRNQCERSIFADVRVMASFPCPVFCMLMLTQLLPKQIFPEKRH